MNRIVGLLATLVSTVLAAENADKPFIAEPVSGKQTIRFYKANKQLQADKILITANKASNSGCNNFLKKVRVFKAQQIGFKSCSLYEKKDCDASSLVPVNAERQERHTYLLTEGVAWFGQSDDERGADVRSWYCGMHVEEGELRLETQLAKTEIKRLTTDKAKALLRLEKAQAIYNDAEKALNETNKYSQRVIDEAVARGVIEPEPEEDDQEDDTGTDTPNDE